MGRLLREQITGSTYHVYSRCIDKQNLMKEDRIKDLMIQVVKETQEKYNFELNAFEILDNHFHFLIKVTNSTDTISKILQRIKSVFARRYNKLHDRSGPFWNERFGSSIVEKATIPFLYFFNIICYMAYNSVKMKLVDDPRNYKYSSINCYLDENYKCQLKITLHKYFLELGRNFNERVEKFLEFEKIYLEKLNLVSEIK